MKNILLFSLMSMMFTITNAQDVVFGLKAGLNTSNWYGSNDDVSDIYNTRSSVHVGALLELNISEKFSLQPEVIYNITGAKVNPVDASRDALPASDILYDVQYISVPLMVRYKFKNNLQLELGPQMGFLVDARTNVDGENYDVKNEFEKRELAMNAGLGFEFENGIFFNVRYEYGLMKIARHLDNNSWNKNNVFQFSTGYKFL